jgi:phosphopantetheinyl transferase
MILDLKTLEFIHSQEYEFEISDFSEFSGREIEFLQNQLDSLELAYLQRFRNNQRFLESLVSIFLVKKNASKVLKIDMSNIGVRHKLNGSPYILNKLDNSKNTNVSIAHTNNIVACIMGNGIRSFQVGIDIEAIPLKFPFNVAKHYTKEERDFIVKSKTDRNYLFSLLWTRKESLMKSLNLSLFDVLKINVQSNYGYIQNHYYYFREYLIQNYLVTIAFSKRNEKRNCT